MSFSDRELLARIIMCEAGGEGENGMKAVATVIMNRVEVPTGEYSRVSEGGNIRNIIMQKGQFTCASDTIGNTYNPQNIYNMRPTDVEYEIADWALSGNKLNEIGECLWFMNPYSLACPQTFPYNRSGSLLTRVANHCFYAPTPLYHET